MTTVIERVGLQVVVQIASRLVRQIVPLVREPGTSLLANGWG